MVDRVKLSQWEYKPDGRLYNEYKGVYDNPLYYNQTNGKINRSEYSGFKGLPREGIIEKGKIIDRFGEPSGEFLSPVGIPFEQRALAPHSSRANYYQYEVKKSFKVVEGEITPWFDQPGGGQQLFGIDSHGNVLSVNELIEQGYIKLIK